MIGDYAKWYMEGKLKYRVDVAGAGKQHHRRGDSFGCLMAAIRGKLIVQINQAPRQVSR